MTTDSLAFILRADLARLCETSSPPAGIRLWIYLIHPRFLPVLLLRLSWYCHQRVWTRPISSILSLLNVVLFGLEATAKCTIGPGLFLPHTSGTVIGAIRIGAHATIFQGVTLGAKFADLKFDPQTRPMIGNHVLIGAGAKVLGGIQIGDHAIIAANSLVIDPVPENALAIGVPALIKKKENNGPAS